MGNTMSDGLVFEDTEENVWRHDLQDASLCTLRTERGCKDGAVYTQGTVVGHLLDPERPQHQHFFFRALLQDAPRGIVFLAHGYNASSFESGIRAQAFRDLGLDVIALDHWGHGRTSGKRVRIWSWQRDLVTPFVEFVTFSNHFSQPWQNWSSNRLFSQHPRQNSPKLSYYF